MTDRQRYRGVIQFKSVDRVPNYEFGAWALAIERWYSEGLPRDVLYGRKWMEGEPYFHIDKRVFIPIDTLPVPCFEEEVLEESERHVTYRRLDGRITRALKPGTRDGQRSSMDQYLEFPVKNRKDFQELKKRYNPQSPVRYPYWFDEMTKVWNEGSYPVSLFGSGKWIGLYWKLREWVGTVGLSYLFYDDPALVHEMLDFLVDFTLEMIQRALVNVRVDCFLFAEDFAFKTAPLVSPEIFKEFFMPRYTRIVEFCGKHGCTIFSWIVTGISRS